MDIADGIGIQWNDVSYDRCGVSIYVFDTDDMGCDEKRVNSESWVGAIIMGNNLSFSLDVYDATIGVGDV